MGHSAAPDNFLESPRTLRKLSCNSGSKGGCEQRGKSNVKEVKVGGGAVTTDAADEAAMATEAQRRAEFEEQCTEYLDSGSKSAKARARKNSV